MITDPPSLSTFDAELAFAREVVEHAGDIVCDMRENIRSRAVQKADRSLVTEADLASHELIAARIRKWFPEDRFLSEEGGDAHYDAGRVWISDPLDGTANYVHGQDHVAVSLALFVDGTPVVGAVRAPFNHQTFWATKGAGAYRDGKRLLLSDPVEPDLALVGIGFPHDRGRVTELIERLHPLLQRFGDVRRLAAPALDICWVADGRLDAFVDRLMIWDVAAAGLIATEAGAVCWLLPRASSAEHNASDGDDYLVAAQPLAGCLRETLLNEA